MGFPFESERNAKVAPKTKAAKIPERMISISPSQMPAKRSSVTSPWPTFLVFDKIIAITKPVIPPNKESMKVSRRKNKILAKRNIPAKGSVNTVSYTHLLAMGYLSLYVQNDFIKGFLSGWLQSFFKYQFWGVFASIAMIGLSIVSFLTNSGSITDPLVIFITGIAFVHAAFNIPKLADNMSAVVISSVVMATISMAAQRGGGTAASATAGAAKSGIRKLFRR